MRNLVLRESHNLARFPSVNGSQVIILISESLCGFQAFGYILVLVSFLLQKLVLMAHPALITSEGSTWSKDWPNLLMHEAVSVFKLGGNVSVFRGIWGILDVYFIPSE